MLQLSGAFINRPVLSLRTGVPVGTALQPIINPQNLKIEGFYCEDKYDKKRHRILLYQDIREIMKQGIVVNDHEALTEAQELVRLHGLIELNFALLGKPVMTVSKEKVGKVTDFAVEVETFFIQKLYVGQSLIKNFTGGSLSIDRSQIVEINARRIIINDLLKQAPLGAAVPAA